LEIDLKNDFQFDYECPFCKRKGKGILDLEKFQVLFDMGIICLKKGYYKEAASDFASALERFHEYTIKKILLNEGTEEEKFSEIWKLVSAQSERQYGAFVFLVFKKIGEVFTVPDKFVKFRNSVIHKGMIPSYEDTYEYAKVIYDTINSNWFRLEMKYQNQDNMVEDEYTKSDIAHFGYESFISAYNYHILTDDGWLWKEKYPLFEETYPCFYEDDMLEVAYG